jgi:hypothetical protein
MSERSIRMTEDTPRIFIRAYWSGCNYSVDSGGLTTPPLSTTSRRDCPQNRGPQPSCIQEGRLALDDVGSKTEATCADGRCSCTTSCNWWNRLGRSARLLPRHCLLCAIGPFQHDDPLVADIVVRDHPHALEGVAFTFGFHSYLCALILTRSRELSCLPECDSLTTMGPVWELLLRTVAGSGNIGRVMPIAEAKGFVLRRSPHAPGPPTLSTFTVAIPPVRGYSTSTEDRSWVGTVKSLCCDQVFILFRLRRDHGLDSPYNGNLASV